MEWFDLVTNSMTKYSKYWHGKCGTYKSICNMAEFYKYLFKNSKKNIRKLKSIKSKIQISTKKSTLDVFKNIMDWTNKSTLMTE